MKPSVSVIILSYNQSEYLLDAIESVINQTVDNWELIIIDNGSTDGSQELLRMYKKNAKISIVLHSENINITVRCNEGVSFAKGEFISFLFSDDYYLPEKLEKQLDCFSGLSTDYGVVHSPAYAINVFTGKKKVFRCINASGYILKQLFARYHEGFINPITPLVRKECFERYPFYSNLFTEGEGIYFRVAMKYKFFYIDEPLAVMREHDRNMRFAKKKNVGIFRSVVDKLAKHPDFPAEYLPLLRTLTGRILRNYGWQDVRLGSDSAWARRLFLLSMSYDWKQVFHPRTIVGGALSLLPIVMREFINNAVNKFLKREKDLYLEDYY